MTPGIILACSSTPPQPPSTISSEVMVHSQFPTVGTTVMHFTGGGMPTQMSVRGVSVQRDCIERAPDGTSRCFRGFVPVDSSVAFSREPGLATSLVAIESAAGSAHASSGVYPSLPFGNLAFRLDNANGTYLASVSTAIASEILIGTGNERGHSGPDYYRITQYFCPFQLQGTGVVEDANHQTCGAAIIAVHRRVDFQGVFIEVSFVNASLPSGITDYDGDKPANPGHIFYSSISLVKDAVGADVNILHFDTFTGDTGPSGSFMVAPFKNGTKRHMSAPGTAPGWTFAMYLPILGAVERATALWRGTDTAMLYSGRGFSENSSFGWGPNRLRHRDARNDGPFALQVVRDGAMMDGTTVQNHITNGTGVAFDDANMVGSRSGVHHAFGALDPNQAGGSLIHGFGLTSPVPEYVHFLRAGAMMATRRSNHTFWNWGTLSPLLPADALTTYNDTSPEDPDAALMVTMLHTGTPDSGASNWIPSAQFASVSPAGGVLGYRPGTQPGQALGGPTGRVWNALPNGSTLGTPAENPAEFVGYSHNLAHSARYHHAYDAWIFGLSVLGRNLSLAYAAYSACYFTAWDVKGDNNDWAFRRNAYCIYAWGSRDISCMPAGSGQIIARNRDGASCGRLSVGEGLSYKGKQTEDFVADRSLAWGMLWQFAGAAIGSNTYRSKTIGQVAAHHPAKLILALAAHTGSGTGFLSSSDIQNPSGRVSPYDDAFHGQTEMANFRGAMPGGPERGDAEYWSYVITFHQDYIALMMDAAVNHDPSQIEAVRRVLENGYWILEAHKDLVEPGNAVARIGRPQQVAASRGTAGKGDARNNIAGNPGGTQADAIAGQLGWGYWPTQVPPQIPDPTGRRETYAGYGFEIENASLGLLVALRYTTPQRRAALISKMARQWNLAGTTSPSSLVASMRAASPVGRQINSRSAPFIAEALIHLTEV